MTSPIGGVLAIDGHGTAVPAVGETPIPGHTYGSVSNLVLSLTAVVWDAGQEQYVLSTFERSDPGIGPLLAHLGRSFVTEVTLQVGLNSRLRCQSFVDVAASALFGAPGSSSQTFDSYVEQSGRVETIWFPFTSAPWLKVWSISPHKPLLSREVTTPYNYVFSDVIPQTLSNLIKEILSGDVAVTPTFGQAELAIVVRRASRDVDRGHLGMGEGPSALRQTEHPSGHRQRVRRPTRTDRTSSRSSTTSPPSTRARWPHSSPKVTSHEWSGRNPGHRSRRAGRCRDGGVQRPLNSPRSARDRIEPDWDVAVWFDILTMPGTPYSDQFYRTIEQWMFAHFTGSYAMVRPEWSKGWALHDDGCLV